MNVIHDAIVVLLLFCWVVCLQVVCEKGLGNNGMTLTSLKGEGFKVVFVGIGECHKHFRN